LLLEKKASYCLLLEKESILLFAFRKESILLFAFKNKLVLLVYFMQRQMYQVGLHHLFKNASSFRKGHGRRTGEERERKKTN